MLAAPPESRDDCRCTLMSTVVSESIDRHFINRPQSCFFVIRRVVVRRDKNQADIVCPKFIPWCSYALITGLQLLSFSCRYAFAHYICTATYIYVIFGLILIYQSTRTTFRKPVGILKYRLLFIYEASGIIKKILYFTLSIACVSRPL